ncbi:MAG: transposase [Proteobacteria bacterium]|nr:transposase [Pseudomonadota bacterium]MDA0992294.1 transposase [Pseudomonadota bacterium]
MHIVQRGNNKQQCFSRVSDYLSFLDALSDNAKRYEVEIHAYVLMTNHVHLLATPRGTIGASRMVQQLGRQYVQTFNKRYERSGTLWEGRYHSSLVDADNYLFACYRYIELNPVRAGMVETPEQYRWSSFNVNAYGATSDLITPRQEYQDLGSNSYERCSHYRRMFGVDLSDDDLTAIRFATNKGFPVGSGRFRIHIESNLGIALGSGIPGRPRYK